jgi:hypothetical protein
MGGNSSKIEIKREGEKTQSGHTVATDTFVIALAETSVVNAIIKKSGAADAHKDLARLRDIFANGGGADEVVFSEVIVSGKDYVPLESTMLDIANKLYVAKHGYARLRIKKIKLDIELGELRGYDQLGGRDCAAKLFATHMAFLFELFGVVYECIEFVKERKYEESQMNIICKVTKNYICNE